MPYRACKVPATSNAGSFSTGFTNSCMTNFGYFFLIACSITFLISYICSNNHRHINRRPEGNFNMKFSSNSRGNPEDIANTHNIHRLLCMIYLSTRSPSNYGLVFKSTIIIIHVPINTIFSHFL